MKRRLSLLLLALTTVSVTPAEFVKPPEQDRNQSHAFLESNLERPLRYHPVDRAFVITNGGEFFNRPLYSANAPFRADAGDQPEFSLYLPGRGGNLRFGIQTPSGTKWLHEMQTMVARYRPGGMFYENRDSDLIGSREIKLNALPLRRTKGLIVRVEMIGAPLVPSELIWAFGGANGMRGRRSGDIGCENEPVSQFFQLRPEQCRDDKFTFTTNGFILQGKSAFIAGVASASTALQLADANLWTNLPVLLTATNNSMALRVVVGSTRLAHNTPFFLALQPLETNTTPITAAALPALFAEAEADRAAIADRVIVETPDPFINATAAALNVAADAVWDARQTSFMHGAVAWRNRLLGWRGQYAGDALGWHERTRQHIAGFAKEQNLNPIPETIPPADEDTNLARSRKAIHSNGNLTKNHYDMNLVAVDAFFRHLLWTGDLDFARELWPMLERHFAWERRMFRREFGPDKLPLYEGYAAIWASDDLTYNGGGATHASAYNFYHNKMAARVAKLIGKDPQPYDQEAGLIAKAMRRELWLPQQGWFAEYKDYLGRQLVHPSAALWTYYHTIDSEVPTPDEALRMASGLDTQFARIPMRGPDVPPGNYTLPTSSWMPYSWSINNVVMAEAMHTALAYWQANRPDGAFPLFKGAALDSMFLGLCPGNVGMCTYFDTYRRESQRDFADGVGATSRALIEGLFGLKPDALAGELTIRPGFPLEWDQASLQHPDLNFSFRREGLKEIFTVSQRFAKPMALRLQSAVSHETFTGATANGQPAKFRLDVGSTGQARVEIQLPAAARHEIVITWNGPRLKQPSTIASQRPPTTAPAVAFDWNKPLFAAKLESIDLSAHFNDRVSQIFSNEYRAPRSPFPSLATPKQGIGSWCHPFDHFTVDDSGLRASARAMASPSPDPGAASRPLWNASKIASRWSSGTPGPLSCTSTTSVPPVPEVSR